MEEVFFSEPGRTTFEIRDGLVFAVYKSGRRSIERCTTIASFVDELGAAQDVVDAFFKKQGGKVRKMRGKH